MTTKNVTKADVLKRVARSMTKSLKAQGHTVSNGAILNALAAADGSINWHVFVKKTDQLVEGVQSARPHSVWVGLHTHRFGTTVYVGMTCEEVYARKRAIALEKLAQDCPEYGSEEPMSDEERVAYYWETMSTEAGESFEISCEELEAESAAPAKQALEVTQLLVASTAHVTREEAKCLDEHDYGYGEYGWLIPVGGDENLLVGVIPEFSEGFAGAIRTARSAGCRYLLLDRDADLIEGVASYDW